MDQQGRALRRSCDRCHAQKLKCSRDGGSYAACVRCRRARQRCVYSARSVRQTASKGGGDGGSASSSIDESPDLPTAQQTQEHLAQQNDEVNDGFDTTFLNMPSMPPFDILHDEFPSFLDWDTTAYQMAGHSISHGVDTSAASSSSQSRQDWEEWTSKSHQQLLLDTLSSILKDLERSLESIVTVWAERDMQRYPVGHVFGLFKKLLVGFETPSLGSNQSKQARSGSGTVVLEGHLRTKTTLLVVQCYVICVNIMSAVAEKLWQDISSLHLASQTSDASSSLQGHGHEPEPSPFTQPLLSARGAQLEVTARSIASLASGASSVDEDLRIGELAAQLDALGHALSSACAALRTGVRLLREIELVIGLPQEHGVAAKGLPVGPLPFPSQVRCGPGSADPRSPCTFIDSSCVARLVVALWGDEQEGPRFGSDSNGPGAGPEKPLNLLRGCYMDIVGLYKHHLLSYYEIA